MTRRHEQPLPSPAIPGARRFLVFVRSGPGSLHPEWLRQDPARNWDCVVSYWGAEPEPCGEEWRDGSGWLKWDAFTDFVTKHPEFLERYEYILLADDDLRFKPGGITKLFLECEQSGLGLLQPALALGSWVNHPVTLQRPGSRVRRTTFVEMMAPVFSREVLGELLDTFLLTPSSLGVDWIWAHRLRGRDLIGIVDAVPVVHTRCTDPTKGALYVELRRRGLNPWADLQEIRARMPVPEGARTCRHRYQSARNGGLRGRVNWVMLWSFDYVARALHRSGILNKLLFPIWERRAPRRR